MRLKYILSLATCAFLGLTSCLNTSVGDDHDAFANVNADTEKLAQKYAAAFAVENGSNHSNKVRVYNNTGYQCNLNYLAGTTLLGCGTQNYVDVIVPFAGNLEFTATLLCKGAFVPVKIPVVIEDLDNELDPLFVALTGGSAEGKKWQWWVGYDYENGNYNYIDIENCKGPVGGGGYGWSATGPNWDSFGVNTEDPWTGQLITMDEWVKFDIDGGANVTVHYSDGTEKKGTFALSTVTKPEKAALGWVGTIKIDVPLPHQIVDGQYSWYLDIPVAEFDVAMLDDEHLILIAPGGGGLHIVCDGSWGISSTHWTFQVVK